MPTWRDVPASGAAAAAGREASRWLEVADGVPGGWDDVAPTEAAVIGFHDPGDDLERRARRWSHRLPDHSLGSLAAFAAGLARAEADAWERDEPHIATQAYEDRRFLAGDRIMHWAVPWLDAAGRCYPRHRATAHPARDRLLDIGDHLRPAPDLGVDSGLYEFGEDAFGPLAPIRVDPAGLRSLWSGAMLLDATLVSLMGHTDLAAASSDVSVIDDLSTLYSVSAARWSGLADAHQGSGALWGALAARALRTTLALSSGAGPD